MLAVTVLTVGQTFTMQRQAQPLTIHYSRNYLISLNLTMWPHQSLALRILDLYVKLPPALWMMSICETLLSISAPTWTFLTSHLHQPHVQSLWGLGFRAGPAQFFMKIFLLRVSNPHWSIWRHLLTKSIFTPDNAAGSRNCISDVSISPQVRWDTQHSRLLISFTQGAVVAMSGAASVEPSA